MWVQIPVYAGVIIPCYAKYIIIPFITQYQSANDIMKINSQTSRNSKIQIALCPLDFLGFR
jgi:hypothetical protein